MRCKILWIRFVYKTHSQGHCHLHLLWLFYSCQNEAWPSWNCPENPVCTNGKCLLQTKSGDGKILLVSSMKRKKLTSDDLWQKKDLWKWEKAVRIGCSEKYSERHYSLNMTCPSQCPVEAQGEWTAFSGLILFVHSPFTTYVLNNIVLWYWCERSFGSCRLCTSYFYSWKLTKSGHSCNFQVVI